MVAVDAISAFAGHAVGRRYEPLDTEVVAPAKAAMV
jgi:hypothetical protein